MYNCTVPVPIVCTANSNDISYQIWYRTVPGLESTVVSLSSFMNSISLSVFVRKEKKENTIETHFHEITYSNVRKDSRNKHYYYFSRLDILWWIIVLADPHILIQILTLSIRQIKQSLRDGWRSNLNGLRYVWCFIFTFVAVVAVVAYHWK